MTSIQRAWAERGTVKILLRFFTSKLLYHSLFTIGPRHTTTEMDLHGFLLLPKYTRAIVYITEIQPQASRSQINSSMSAWLMASGLKYEGLGLSATQLDLCLEHSKKNPSTARRKIYGPLICLPPIEIF